MPPPRPARPYHSRNRSDISYFSQGLEHRQYAPPPVDTVNPSRKYNPVRQSTFPSPNYGNYGAITPSYSNRRRRSSVGDWDLLDQDDHSDDEEGRFWVERVFFRPKRKDVKKVVNSWFARWFVMVIIPAAVVVGWCAIPIPHMRIEEDDGGKNRTKIPGHGEATVKLNFWFFLVVYYGFYNLIGLFWITKLFNLYAFNWWPASLGLPLSYTAFWSCSLLLAIPIYWYLTPLTAHNITWVILTFFTMACPLLVAFLVLHLSQRHRASYTPSETQQLFSHLSPTNSLRGRRNRAQSTASITYLPTSYRRFLWFCAALGVSLIALLLGETYAEVYLRTLPHNTIETLFYVYSWVITIYLLDLLTGWILGSKVESYPLAFVFKLYFYTTYQTYVRALYARLRSPSQFAYLQLLSSSLTIIAQPTLMHPLSHRFLTATNLTASSYHNYLKLCSRALFLKPLAENVTMIAFCGWLLVLHYGPNRAMYPYFEFPDVDDGSGEKYTFKLTFWASGVIWACEIAAGWIMRRIVAKMYGVRVTEEGVKDLVRYPELVVACVAVMMHCSQNILFGIIRLRFW